MIKAKTIMFLGLSTYTFPWTVSMHSKSGTKLAAARQILDFAAENQVRFVQFADNLPLHSFSGEELRKIKLAAVEKGISIETGTRRLSVDNLERYIPIARQMESSFLRVVIDDEDYHPGGKEVINIIREVLPCLKKNDLILAIENHDRFTAEVLKNIIRSTDESYIGICLDTANSIGAGEGIQAVLETLTPYIINLHIKDISIRRMDHKMGFIVEGTAAGYGMIDISSIIYHLNQTGRCNTAILEIWSCPAASAEATLANEILLTEKSIRYLKNLLT